MGNENSLCCFKREERTKIPSIVFIKSHSLENFIGKGGTGLSLGDVFVGSDLKSQVFDVKGMIKRIDLNSLSNEDKEIVSRETTILKNLIPGNNVQNFTDIFEENGSLYISMELCDDRLAQLIETRRKNNQAFKFKEILKIGLQVANGIFYLHENNIIHGDINPKNIFAHKINAIKLANFGLAKFPNEKAWKLSYMAPEQNQEVKASFAVDSWAFGCLLYELSILKNTSKTKTLPSKFPIHYLQVVQGCLEKDENKRMDVAGALILLTSIAAKMICPKDKDDDKSDLVWVADFGKCKMCTQKDKMGGFRCNLCQYFACTECVLNKKINLEFCPNGEKLKKTSDQKNCHICFKENLENEGYFCLKCKFYVCNVCFLENLAIMKNFELQKEINPFKENTKNSQCIDEKKNHKTSTNAEEIKSVENDSSDPEL